MVSDLEREMWRKYIRVTGLEVRPGESDVLHILVGQCREEFDAFLKEWDAEQKPEVEAATELYVLYYYNALGERVYIRGNLTAWCQITSKTTATLFNRNDANAFIAKNPELGVGMEPSV